MKKKLVKCLSILIVFNLFSCSFMGEETVDISPQKSKIVMFAEIANDKEWSQAIVLSRTRNLNQEFDFDITYGDTIFAGNGTVILNGYPPILLDSVKGANIKLSSQNKEVANFRQTDSFLKSFYDVSNLNLKEGELCKLQISAPGFDTVFAEQIVPKSVKLAKAYFKRNSFKSPKTGTLCELFLEIDNDSAAINYYAADVSIKRSSKGDDYYYEPKLIKLDPNADTPKFLNSKNFNTKRYVWRIGIDIDNDFTNNPDGNPSKPIPKELVNLRVKFRSTTKDFNEYAKNLQAVNSAKDNLFSEPITPFTNVKNGYGVFVVSGKPDTLSLPLK